MTPLARELLDLGVPALRDHAIVLLDPTGIIVGWLGGAELIMGYREQEIVGCHFSALFVPEDVQSGLPKHELDIARRSPYAEDDRWHVRADGTRVWISGAASAIRDASGAVRGFIKIMRDRTDLRMNTELRSNQLEMVQGTLDRTHEFLRTLGHELRNPLAPIKTAAAVLPRVSGDSEKVNKMAQTVANQVGVLERLVDDLMDVSRLTHKKLELKLAEFDLRPLVEEQIAGHLEAAHVKDLHLECLVPDQPLPVVADAGRIRQAVANLLVNAVKYTPEGGTIWVKATQEAEDVLIKVQDTGIGIAPELLPRVFELFTRDVRAQELAPEGMGVGLAIVSQIAELHGGLAQVRSGGNDKGSEFTLRLARWGPKVTHDDDSLKRPRCWAITTRRPQSTGASPRSTDAFPLMRATAARPACVGNGLSCGQLQIDAIGADRCLLLAAVSTGRNKTLPCKSRRSADAKKTKDPVRRGADCVTGGQSHLPNQQNASTNCRRKQPRTLQRSPSGNSSVKPCRYPRHPPPRIRAFLHT